MIGLNWKKTLVVAGAVLGLAAVPALTQAHTQDVIPPSVAMSDTPVMTPVKKVSTMTVASKKTAHKKIARKASAKHKLTRKHKKLSKKKHTA